MRPSNGQRRPTTHVRLMKDLAEKLAVIAFHERVSTAVILDPVIREWIEARYLSVPETTREVFAARVAGELPPAPAA